MSSMTPRERVLAAMRMEEMDRPPVAVFTQSATIGQMQAIDVFWPAAHSDAKLMAKLGAAQAEVLGFEAVRAPFCLTAEAERLGAKVDPGKQDRTPMLKEHPFIMNPMEGAIDAVHRLSKTYDVYILSTSPWLNPTALQDKLDWIKKYFGDDDNNIFYKRVIFSHNKHLLKGDYLIDDRTKNGADRFEGKLIQFGSVEFPNWMSVLDTLLPI